MTTLNKILAASAAMFALLMGGVSAANADEEIANRIKPYGTVCLAGQECATEVGGAATAAAGAAGRSGEAVYGQFCTACHGPGILDAPKTGDDAVWQERLSAAGDLDALTASAIAGVGAMPPKGTCGNCSDDEIKAAIEHMAGF